MESTLSVIKYDVTDAAIIELRERYAGMKIVDSASYEHVRVAIGEVRTKRTGVEKRRKELKAYALDYGRKVDAEAKRLTDALLTIENPLQTEKDRVDAEKEAVRQAKALKEKERVDGIRARITAFQHLLVEIQGKSSDEILKVLDNAMDCEAPEEIFMEFTAEANKSKEEVINGLVKAYQEKLKAEKEAEALKIEQERLAKQKAEQEEAQRKIDEENRKVREAQEKLEAERKAEKERQERAEFEHRAQEEAKVRAEAEAREKVEREAKQEAERIEKERIEKERKAAMAPDKEKLLTFADEIAAVKTPVLDSEQANTILSDASKAIRKILAMIRKEAEKL
jgi:colicin import membrane protein